MSFKTVLRAATAALLLAGTAQADDTNTIMVEDAYARVSTQMSGSGAAFMMLMNTGDADDRLIGAQTDAAERAELHTHKENADGVMQMIHVEEGFAIPAGGMHALARGGDHVMLMGLTRPLSHGDTVDLVLTFEKAGDIAVTVPVDLERKPQHGMNHGQMKKN